MLWKSFRSFSKVRAGSRKAAHWTQHTQHPLGAPNHAHGTGCCLGKEPLLKEQDMKHKVYFIPGHCTSCTQTQALEAPQFSQCFPKQTSRVSSGCACANSVRKDFIHSCRFTPSEKSPCQSNLQAELDVTLAAWTPSPCSHQHPSTNQPHRPWWLCSCVLPHVPETPARVSKAKESLSGYLHLQGT